MSLAIETKNLKFGYNKNLVLNGLDLEIGKGELVFIKGGNGSGKTTLVKILLGILKAGSGEVKIFGKPVSQSQISKTCGYVPQYSDLERDFPITVEEVIAIECRADGKCSLGTKGHLAAFKAEELLDKRISELSGGQFQKMLIARALVSDPQILILDEPTNNLDMKAHEYLHQILTRLHKQGKTIIVVTHDYTEPDDQKDKTKTYEIIDGRLK